MGGRPGGRRPLRLTAAICGPSARRCLAAARQARPPSAATTFEAPFEGATSLAETELAQARARLELSSARRFSGPQPFAGGSPSSSSIPATWPAARPSSRWRTSGSRWRAPGAPGAAAQIHPLEHARSSVGRPRPTHSRGATVVNPRLTRPAGRSRLVQIPNGDSRLLRGPSRKVAS